MSDTPRTDAEVKRTAKIAAMSGMEQAWQDICWHAKELERELAAERNRANKAEQRHADATGEWKRQKESAQILLGKYEDAKRRADEAECDAKRYRWLRDKSVPPHNFYIGVPVEFHEVRYMPSEVDAYIDEAMRNG